MAFIEKHVRRYPCTCEHTVTSHEGHGVGRCTAEGCQCRSWTPKNATITTWRARVRKLDGREVAKTFKRRADAERWKTEQEAMLAAGTWADPRRGERPFARWADQWWMVWSAHPDRSPTTLEAAENRLRRHVRPTFDPMPLRGITANTVQQWQNTLQARLGQESVMACRSLLYRILEAAVAEGLIPTNPVARVSAPKRRVDPAVALGEAKLRILTPQEAGLLLAAHPRFWWDHVVTLLGTGLRISELAGLRRARVDLLRRRLQVVDTRYQAGARFGSGFKPRPKSDAAIREIPLCGSVVEAISRCIPPGAGPDVLVFTGPGGGNGVQAGTRTIISRDNFRRTYQRAVQRAGLEHLNLSGPHDLRHTFASWLEDAGIPDRVIDELMGHASGRRAREGSAIGRRYRHTSEEMRARVLAALDERLGVALAVAQGTTAPAEAAGS